MSAKSTKKTKSPFAQSIQREKANAFKPRYDFEALTQEEVLLERQKNSLEYHIACFNLNGSNNMGQIMRTGELMGCEKFWWFGRKSYDKRTDMASRIFLHAEHVENIFNIDQQNILDSQINTEELINFFMDNNLIPIFIELPKDDTVPYEWCHEVDWMERMSFSSLVDKKICFVLGNESLGVPDDVLMECIDKINFSKIVAIKQRGIINSHNVACAATIVLTTFYNEMLRNGL